MRGWRWTIGLASIVTLMVLAPMVGAPVWAALSMAGQVRVVQPAKVLTQDGVYVGEISDDASLAQGRTRDRSSTDRSPRATPTSTQSNEANDEPSTGAASSEPTVRAVSPAAEPTSSRREAKSERSSEPPPRTIRPSRVIDVSDGKDQHDAHHENEKTDGEGEGQARWRDDRESDDD